LKVVKEYAAPRSRKTLSTAKLNKAKVLLDRGYTQAEVAGMLSISTNLLMNSLNEGG